MFQRSEAPPAPRRRIFRLSFAATLLSAGMLLAGCSPASVAVDVSDGPPPGDVVALPDGSIERAIDRLPELAESVLEETGIPGLAVAVVHGDGTVFADGYGVRTRGEDAEIDAETVFQVASISKSISATVTASQVSEGIVDWNDRVIDHLPGFALSDPWVTDHLEIGDLYSHRSGLPHAAGDDLEDIGYDRAAILERLRLQPLAPFRGAYNYANFGITAAAEAVAAAAGTSWDVLADQALYGPLGMEHTSSRYDDFLSEQNRASLHARVDGGFAPLYQRDADEQSPAGGVSSNVQDLAKWLRLLLADGSYQGEELIQPQALMPALTAQSISAYSSRPGDRTGHYGYGFNVGTQPGGRVAVGHSGAFALGAGTTFQILPDADLGIVVLTNAAPVGAAEALAASFLDLAQFGEITRDWVGDYAVATAGNIAPAGDLVDQSPPAAAGPSRDLGFYAGRYTSSYFGDAVVTVNDGSLEVALGPDRGYRFTLEEWDGDTFAFVPTGENAPQGSHSSVVFTSGGSRASSLTIDFFDTNGLGTWTR
jgi:CubicO group peptidase (beta-lactamase class C family)